MNLKTWCHCFVLFCYIGLTVTLNAAITEQKVSTQFQFKYEADASEPTIENPDDWSIFDSSPTVNSVTDGILNCTFVQNQMWFTTESAEAFLDHTVGWTYEVRLKVIGTSNSRGSVALMVDDQVSTSGGANGFQIHDDRTQWAIDGADASTSRNDDVFHVFRLAEEANSNTVHGWRDGLYLGSAVGGHDFSQTTLLEYVMLGSFSSALTGTVEVDYIRWDPSGAYAPYSPVVFDTGDGLEVAEQGQASDTYTVGLAIEPTDDVTVTITVDPAQLSLESTAETSIELVFTPLDYSAKTVQVNAVDDSIAEGFHSSAITHSFSSNDTNYNGLIEYANVSIADNDVLFDFSNDTGKEVDENGLTSDSYTIHCLQQPAYDVVIEITGDSDKLAFGPSVQSSYTITFTPADWETPQTVDVHATDNTGWNRLRYYPVIHTVQSSDASFDGFDLGEMTVLVWDDDYYHSMPPGYTIPIVDMDQPHRQVIVDKEEGQYLGHVTTCLMEDKQTILAVYPKGHGSGAIVYKRSYDGGLTWTDRLPTPASWDTSREVPTLYRMVDPQGVERIIMFSGVTNPVRRAYSEDKGKTWTELEDVGDWSGIVVMGCYMRLKDGRYMGLFHDDGRFFPNAPRNMRVYKSYTSDGGLTWTWPEVVIDCTWASPCEPGIVRSPDGDQLVVLFRENSRRYNALMFYSNDEGETWSDLHELPASLTGDRHTAQYGPDGRLFISFRDRALSSQTWGDWVGWVGTYDDIMNLDEGQYRVRVKDNLSGADTTYPGVEILPNGEIVTTTYGTWESGEEPYIVSSRFRFSEIDAEHQIQNEGASLTYCGQAGTVYLSGDLNRDCYVNIEDLKVFLSDWLNCTDPASPLDCN